MKFKCPKCKKIFKRDIRHKAVQASLTRGGNLHTMCKDSCFIIAKKVEGSQREKI